MNYLHLLDLIVELYTPPPFSQIYFEKYFYNYIQLFNNRIFKIDYIPVFWTELQISEYNKTQLQDTINQLDTK